MSLRNAFARTLARIEAGTSGYLAQMGWVESRARRVAIDQAGRSIPWFTYPAVRLLQDRARPDWRVLEFGAGGGTRWWAGRVRSVTAVEHDPGWAAQVAATSTAQVLKTGADSAEVYLRPAVGSGPYQVVVVDGLFRNECLALAPGLLAADGFIILDDAQREEYAPAVAAVRAQGFKLLELHGPQPVSKHPGCTAFLYRDGNALGL